MIASSAEPRIAHFRASLSRSASSARRRSVMSRTISDLLLVRQRQDTDLGVVLALVAGQYALGAHRRTERPGLDSHLFEDRRNRSLRKIRQPLTNRRREHRVLIGRLPRATLDNRAVPIEPQEQIGEREDECAQLGACLQQLTGSSRQSLPKLPVPALATDWPSSVCAPGVSTGDSSVPGASIPLSFRTVGPFDAPDREAPHRGIGRTGSRGCYVTGSGTTAPRTRQ